MERKTDQKGHEEYDYTDCLDFPDRFSFGNQKDPIVLEKLQMALANGTAGYVDPKKLGHLIRANPGTELSPEILTCICDCLEGKMKNRREGYLIESGMKLEDLVQILKMSS